jgi:hypothetical protein
MLEVDFRMLDFRQIARSLGVVLSFAPGDRLFREGDAPHCMYVLLEGQVEVCRRDRVIETVGPAQALGIVSLLDEQPRTVTAQARTACKAVAIDAGGVSLRGGRGSTFRVVGHERAGTPTSDNQRSAVDSLLCYAAAPAKIFASLFGADSEPRVE